ILQPRQWEALQGAALCAVKNLDFFVLRSPLLELLQMRFSAEVARIGAAVRVRPKKVRAVHIEPQQHNAGCAQVAQAVQSQDAAIAAAAECVGLDLLDAGNLVRAELPSCETMSLRVQSPPLRVVRDQHIGPRRQLVGIPNDADLLPPDALSQFPAHRRARRKAEPQHQATRTPSDSASVKCSSPESLSGITPKIL